MRKPMVASILSCVYCGLGQIYNHQTIKGIDFIIIYTILIVSIFVPAPSLPWLPVIGISVLPLMWLIGVVDAYLGEEAVFRKKQWLLAVLPGVVISLLLSWWIQYAQIPPAPDVSNSARIETPECFSVEVASFTRSGEAETLRDILQSKGYPVEIVKSVSIAGTLYHVVVGKFDMEEDAISLAEKLRQQYDLCSYGRLGI